MSRRCVSAPMREDARKAHRLQRQRDFRQRQHPLHLGADALGGEAAETARHAAAGIEATGIEVLAAVARREPEEAVDAEAILGDAHVGIADEAHAADERVVDPADRIEQRARRIGVERVHREIAALGIAAPVGAELHHRLAAVGLDVLAQRRDFGGESRRSAASPCRARCRWDRQRCRRPRRATSPGRA